MGLKAKRITEIKTLKKFCQFAAKEFNADLKFFNKFSKDGAIGKSWIENGREKIEIYAGDYEIDYVLSVFFHELGHLTCRQNKIYPAYHGLGKNWKTFAKALVSHGLQAERYVDSLGKEISLLYFPKGTFKWFPSYKSKEDVEWFEELREEIKQELLKMKKRL